MRIGIMQGRLSPPQGDQLQFFPKDWKAEFAIAQKIGFEAIEWIYDDNANPILGWSGRNLMLLESRQQNVRVESICADIFLHHHLITRKKSVQFTLANLFKIADLAGINLIGIPLLESNLPVTADELSAVAENIRAAMSYTNGNVRVALEADLPAERILELIGLIDSPRVGVCYDTGNAMTQGFDAGADIRKLGLHLKEIHFKDRLARTTRSVFLGEGSVNFLDVFSALKEVNFDGLCILQAWRGENYLDDAKRQLEFVKNQLAR